MATLDRNHDVRTLIARAREDADDLGNALDAGMNDAASSALAKVQADLGEIEREATRNGPVPLHAVPKGNSTPMPSAPEAEDAVLGAMMMAPAAIRVASQEVRPEYFNGESNRLIFEAILQLDHEGVDVDSITVADKLESNGQIGNVNGTAGGPGGKARVHEIAATALTSTNVAHYARIVRRVALERRLQMAVMTPTDTEAISEAAAALTRERVIGGPRRALDAAEWLAAQPDGCPAVWGDSDRVLWAEGEPLMIYGPDGVGKTSLAQQVVLHLCGVRLEPLLDLPVRHATQPILYLACDRPRQARRSLYRMLPRDEHEKLQGRLCVWEGPLPFSLPGQPRALLEFAQLHEAGIVVIDSLKDVAVMLTDPETALKVIHAFQWLMANGVELLVLHHPRKDPAGMPARPKTLEDVYGDRNFVAGMGSVISLYGKAGDPIVQLEHLKQPAAEVGPFKILHRHDEGATTMYEHSNYVDILMASARPVTVAEAAARFYATKEPLANQLEKTRRELRKMVNRHEAIELRTDDGEIAFSAR